MSNSGIFFAEKVPEKGDNRIVCAAEGLCHKIMCAPKSASIADVELAAGPSGTRSGWTVAIDRSDHCVECADDPTRNHWFLEC